MDVNQQIQNTSAIVIFFVTLFLGLIILTILAGWDFKLIKYQAKEIDKYMQPLIDAKTLLTMSNYREAAKQKSIYLLFKRTFVLVIIILCLIIFYAFYIPFGCKGYVLDGTEYSPSSIFWLMSRFGVTGAKTTTSLGGISLIYGFFTSALYTQIPLALRVTTIVVNLFSFIILLCFLYQVQGYVCRLIRI